MRSKMSSLKLNSNSSSDPDTSPSVSVLMTVYNAASLLERSVHSILEQTFTDFEFVVVDDGSTDDSVSIIESYALRDSRILLLQAGRLTRYPALNFGLKECRGKYVVIMDADDYSYPERIGKQAAFLDANPEVAGLGTGYFLVDERTRKRQLRINPVRDGDIRNACAKYIPICHTSAMIRRSALVAAGGYVYGVEPPFNSAEDLRIWIHMALAHKLTNLAEPLVDHYLHEKSFNWGPRWRNYWGLAKINAYAIRMLKLPWPLYLLLPLRFASFMIPFCIRTKLRSLMKGTSQDSLPYDRETALKALEQRDK